MTRTKKNKIKEEKVKVWRIGVTVDQHKWTVREGDGIMYGDGGETDSSWNVKGLILVEEGKPNDFGYRESTEVNFEPKRGKTYHLLYAVYSTGDSFSHASRACFEVVGVYRDRKVAEENEKRLREGKPTVEGQWGNRVVLLMEGMDKKQEYYPPWNGHFESLDYLRVESFILN